MIDLLRGIGVLSLLVAGSGLGMVLAERHRRRPRELAALRTALQVLLTEIDVGLTPLPEALTRAGLATTGVVRALFLRAAALLRSAEGLTGGEAWSAVLAALERDLALEPAEIDILRGLAPCLGRSSREDQRRHLQLAAARLEAAEREALSTWQQRHRVTLYLGIIGSAIVVLTVI